MTVEEALVIVDVALGQKHLSDLQELVFRQSWQGQTYLEIAESAGYDPDYLKDVGFKLWQLLSKAFGEKVSKSNIQSFLRWQLQQTHGPATLSELVGASDSRGRKPQTNQLEVTSDLVVSGGETVSKRQDWGEAIDVSTFYGRTHELTTLKQWILKDRCRLVVLLGMGGVGKTALAVKLAEQTQHQFEYLIWRSLRNAPRFEEILAELNRFVAKRQGADLKTTTVDGRVTRLLEYLRSRRCLIVLDNAESILRSGTSVGRYRRGYEGYGQLLRCVAETSHQSCFVLTSREKPNGLTSKEGDTLPVRSFQLMGLPEAAGQEILKAKHLSGSADAKRNLIECYRGNPLALKIAAATIQVLFDRSIARFLEQGTLVFGDIGDLLNKQLNRLSVLEKQIIYWLITDQQQISLPELQAQLLPTRSKGELIEALESLQRRSLIEKSSAGFTQQPMIMEYLNNRASVQSINS
jgi:hypothetical protein